MDLALHRPKKLQAGIVLVTLALAALFIAQGVSSLIARALLRQLRPASKRVAAQAGPPLLGAASPDLCAILKRNAFDVATGALCPPPAPAAPEPPPRPPLPGETPPACEGETLKLVAAVHSERDPAWSFAEVTSDRNVSRLFQPGERVGDREVFAIYPTSVLFKQASGHYCSIAMFAGTASSCPLIACSPPTPLRASESDITVASDTRLRVRRALVDRVLADQEGLVREIRIIPYSEHGKLVGLKLYGIRRGSLFDELGLRSGDLLRTVNGMQVATPDAALEAYAKLRGASQLALALERRGQPITLEYAIE